MSRIEELSADLEASVRRRLAYLCRNAKDHARFLNTLSLMEHIGSRKIMVSQSNGPRGCEVLKHLSEEARHAYFFKRQAERLAKAPLTYDDADTLVPASARMYFGRLDAGINAALGHPRSAEVPYLYVSMIIEVRAVWAYGIYHQVLAENHVGLSLKSVLAEEELHLPQMATRLSALGEATAVRLPAFVQLEDRLFRALWARIEAHFEDREAVRLH